MRAWRIQLTIFYSCVLTSFNAVSQSNGFTSAASKAEKIYLQFDNTVYTNDQTIWFRAVVARAEDHVPTTLSGVLHTELIDASGNTIEAKLIKLEGGIGNSFFQLSKNYLPGVYLVRAYTEWNKNFGPEFFFSQYIQVFGSATAFQPSPIANMTLVEDVKNKRRLSMRLDPLAIDQTAGKELSVYLTLDGKKDSMSVKRNGNNQYLLDYAVPDQCRYVTLSFRTSNQISYAKTIALDTNYLDVQLFPESGEMIDGLSTVLGVKVVDYNGCGQAVKAEVLNGKGKAVASFQTNALGMGKLMLDSVHAGQTYTARILSPTISNTAARYELPVVVAKGNSLSLARTGTNIALMVRSNYLLNDSVTIRASCRGFAYYDFKGRLSNGSFVFLIPADLLPEGVIVFTLLTGATEPVAERLYFNQRPETRMKLGLSLDQQSYEQRGETKLSIETKSNNAMALPASLSVLVVDQSQGSLLSARQNLLSYFLLSSDLKGEIENPGFYFDTAVDRFEDLDALLLTQGWRQYKYTRDSMPLPFLPERNLAVSGSVKSGLFTQKGKKEVDLTFLTFGETPSFQTQKTDSLGRFIFPLGDEYGQNLKFLIQTTNKTGNQKAYTITLDKKETLPVNFNALKLVERPDSIVQEVVKKSIERKKAEDAYLAATGGLVMDEVTVKAYAMTPERKLVTETYGKPQVVIEGDAIRAKEAKWSYGLYSVLLFNFPDKVHIFRTGDGMLYARLLNREITLVVIDGIPVKDYDYGLIAGIPPSEVKTFELIEYAQNFRKLYCETVTWGCGLDAPTIGNVIAIYTYGGKGIFGVKPPLGLAKLEMPVFATPRDFYAPRYEQLTPEGWQRPDLRSLIHWEPHVVTDSLGRATVSFYNADNPGKMKIIVEAISENGMIGYQELFYEVELKTKIKSQK